MTFTANDKEYSLIYPSFPRTKKEATMPIDMPLDWSPTRTERAREVSIKMPNLFLVFMLIVYALCLWAMIDAFQHNVTYPFDLGPA